MSASPDRPDPFNGNSDIHMLYKVFIDEIADNFNDEIIPAHVEQSLMLLFLSEVNISFVEQAMVDVEFRDRSEAKKGLKTALSVIKNENKSLIDQTGMGASW